MFLWMANCIKPVSYTHLDVYKRQPYGSRTGVTLSVVAIVLIARKLLIIIKDVYKRQALYSFIKIGFKRVIKMISI